jgi:hypothetical protein
MTNQPLAHCSYGLLKMVLFAQGHSASSKTLLLCCCAALLLLLLLRTCVTA